MTTIMTKKVVWRTTMVFIFGRLLFCFGQAIMKRLQAWKRDHVLEFSRIVLVVEEKTKFWLYSQES